MELLIYQKQFSSNRHDWKYASSNYVHMNGVSSLAWCKRCGEETITGSASKICLYSLIEYKTYFNGENIIITSQKSIDNAVELCIKDMIHTARKLTKNGMDIPVKDFQGTTSIFSSALSYLKNNEILTIVDDNFIINLNKLKYNNIKEQ